MKYLIKFFFISFFIIINLVSPLKSKLKTININSNFKTLNIGELCEYKSENNSRYTFNYILTNKNIIWKKGSKYFNLGNKSKVIWLKFKINNPYNKYLFLWLDGNLLTHITLYIPENGRYKKYHFDLLKNKIDSIFVNVHKPVIRLPQNLSKKTIYLKIESNKVVIFTPILEERNVALHKLQKELIIFWLYSGLMIIIIIIMLISYFLLKDYIYLIFSIYIIGWLGFNLSLKGFGRIYLWNNSIFMINKSLFIFGNIIGWSSAIVIKFILNAKKNYPLINKILVYGISYPILFLSIFIPFSSVNKLFQILTYQTIYIITLNFIILFYTTIFKKNKFALLLFLGYIGIIWNNIGLILISKSLYYSPFFLHYSTFISNVWLVTFFIIALLIREKDTILYINKLEEKMNFMQYSIENSSDAALWVDEKGDIIYLNKSASSLYGIRKDEKKNILSLRIFNYYEWGKILKNKTYQKEIELYINGRKKYFDITSNFVKYQDKNFIFIYIKDITERKERELEILKSKKNLEVTLESIGDAVIATDIEEKIIFINPVACELTGWKKEEAIGKKLSSVFNIINAETRLPVKNPIEKVLTTGKVIGLANHTLLISKNKKEYQISDSGAPIKLNGKIIGVVLVFRDVTEEYILNERLHQAEKMDAIGQLAGGIAHDFNNMINGIMSSAELLLMEFQDSLNEDIKNYINTIIKMAEKSAHLTKQLLIFSRKSKFQNTIININSVILETINILERTLPKKITIKYKFHTNKKLLIKGDPIQLETALLNLGINARDAMPEGGVITFNINIINFSKEKLKRYYKDMPTTTFVKISISDTGIGIEKDKIKKIFDPFYTTKPEGAGTGLGLAAVERIVSAHNGFIEVESEINKGSEFSLYFPLITEEKKKERKSSENIVKGKGYIIGVEDEELLKETLSKMLSYLGYQNKIFEDGFKFLEYYKENFKNIDIVLLDIIMPRIYGTELFYKIKEINPDQKIIFMSGYNKDVNIENFKKEGLNGFIGKPFSLSKLSQILYEVMNS